MSTLKINNLNLLPKDQLGVFAGTLDPLKIFKGEQLKTELLPFLIYPENLNKIRGQTSEVLRSKRTS